jgi:hypothetical protein
MERDSVLPAAYEGMERVRELGGLHVIALNDTNAAELKTSCASISSPGRPRLFPLLFIYGRRLMRLFGGTQADNLMQSA